MKLKGVCLALVFALSIVQGVTAQTAIDDLDLRITAQEKAELQPVLSPLVKVIHIIQYGGSLIAVLMLMVVGIMYVYSANDPRRRGDLRKSIQAIFLGLVLLLISVPLVKLFL